jgi:hypothetical protein
MQAHTALQGSLGPQLHVVQKRRLQQEDSELRRKPGMQSRVTGGTRTASAPSLRLDQSLNGQPPRSGLTKRAAASGGCCAPPETAPEAKVFHNNECLMREVSDCSCDALHLFSCGHLFCASCVVGGLRSQASGKRKRLIQNGDYKSARSLKMTEATLPKVLNASSCVFFAATISSPSGAAARMTLVRKQQSVASSLRLWAVLLHRRNPFTAKAFADTGATSPDARTAALTASARISN